MFNLTAVALVDHIIQIQYCKPYVNRRLVNRFNGSEVENIQRNRVGKATERGRDKDERQKRSHGGKAKEDVRCDQAVDKFVAAETWYEF